MNYDLNGAHYTRENFVSYPDNVLVTRLTATDGGTLDFDVRVEPDEEKAEVKTNRKQILTREHLTKKYPTMQSRSTDSLQITS